MTTTALQAEPTVALDAHIMRTYARQAVTLVRGAGCYVWDESGRRYLDFLAGIAVNGVGHCHPSVVRAVQEQAGQLMHASNLYNTLPQNRLADALIATTGGEFESIFFCNSGAEAIEAALKLARKHGKTISPAKTKIVTATGSFHGRTYGALSATAQAKYQEPFAPMVPGFSHVSFNDVDALQDAVGDDTCAVLIEPIQGEGGVYPADVKFLQYARGLCSHYGALLIFDEIQTGMGRTGTWWNYQQRAVVPDVFTTAKSLGGGLPIGACVARGEAAGTLAPGDHGSTFAGNAVCCAAALATIDVIESEHLLHNAAAMGDSLRRRIKYDLAEHVAEVRGAGLMIGVQLKQPIARQIQSKALESGLIVNAIGDSILRLLPPLIVTQEQVDDAMDLLQGSVSNIA